MGLRCTKIAHIGVLPGVVATPRASILDVLFVFLISKTIHSLIQKQLILDR